MKKSLIAAALALASVPAFAQMTNVDDEVLGTQTGQEGISIALTIKAHIDDVIWTDDGNSLHFQDIAIGSGSTIARQVGFAVGGNTQYLSTGTDYSNPVIFLSPIRIDVKKLDQINFTIVDQGMGTAPAGLVNVNGTATNVPNGNTLAPGYVVNYADYLKAYGANDVLEGGAGSNGAPGSITGTNYASAIVIEMPRTVASFRVGAIKVGNGASMGSLEMKGMDFYGTKVAIWGHQ
ncbi:DUF6160 family protein [Chitinivorax sp. PXF-14]|uniref:DUF6160 family protein n=1 Tax=Chitinivorax sp. PXF-14 TaxID=3230488 RepID=UPI00346545C0